jgi:Protein of unknown function (DUF3017)
MTRVSTGARGRPAVVRELPFAVVLLIAAAGLATVVVASQHWLRGVLVIASSLVVAGAARAVLPDRRAGMLAVRGKLFDVACYLVLGGAMIGFGLTASALSMK